MYLSPLYHWSPARLRTNIMQAGLIIYAAGARYVNPVTLETERVQVPWICFGTDPQQAWSLVPEPDAEDPDRDGSCGWDLWQAEIEPSDGIRIRDDFGPKLREVRVLNSISPDRLWWIGHRKGDPHL